MADYKDIAGRIRTTAADGIVVESQEIIDLQNNKTQQEINSDVQTELSDRYTKEETYSKEQLDDLITTPDVNYVSVVATNTTTAVTDILPATGEANTIYRVGNWNGTQYDTTMYALFAWNGTTYVCLAVRSFVGEVYDASVNHPDGQGDPTPYADLAAALGTDGANIPADIRRGGMSIKFIQGTVQGSDHKYVQYRLMTNEFTTDTTQWAIADESVYVENPEFVMVITDKDGRILLAVEKNGNARFGAGVPQQVIDYINEKISELSLEEIVAFLGTLINGDKTLSELLNEKVDKEEGKSLIDEYVADSVRFVENPEWIRVITDVDDRILCGIKADGSIEWSLGVPTPIKKYIDGFVEILNNKVDKEEGKSLINEDYANGVTYVYNNEWIHAVVDSEKRILEGLKADGTKVFYKIDAKDVGENLLKVISDCSRWKNKNIAYFGTSVPAQGYPQIVGAKLGANVYNQAIGSSMMRCGIPTADYINHNELGDDLGLGGVYFGNIMRSMSRTQSELRYIFDNWTADRRKANLIAKGYTAEQVANVIGYVDYIGGSFPEEHTDPTTPQNWPSTKPVDVYAGDGETYKTFRQMAYSYCWDNSEDIESDLSMSGAITGTVKGRMQKFIDGEINTDLFVFDHFRNDCIDSTSSQYLEIPQNPLDRNYAEGAFNYLVSQILLVKPNAKIVIVGHIDNDDTKAQLGHVWEAQEIAANRWGVLLLKLWEELGIRCYGWVTTTGYWDSNGVWHESGYNGSNHVWHSNNGLTAAEYENPRQIYINGVLTWVHDLTTRMIWLKDDIHPTGTLALNHFATIIASWLKTI